MVTTTSYLNELKNLLNPSQYEIVPTYNSITCTHLNSDTLYTTAEYFKEKEIIVKAVKELHCPNCNAPIKLKNTNSGKLLAQNCEYCGSLLTFEVN